MGQIDKIPIYDRLDWFIESIHKLLNNSELCVDEHHADQLMIFMALASGTSQIASTSPLNGHIKGMIRILTQFIPDLNIETTEQESSTLIKVDGIGYK